MGDRFDLDDVHLVASVVVVDSIGRVLLARHARYRKWGPIGGHVEPTDLSLIDAAVREVFEETGLAVEIGSAPIDLRLSEFRCGSTTSPFPHLDVRFAAVLKRDAAEPAVSDELSELGRFDLDDLPSPLADGAVELVALAHAAIGWPMPGHNHRPRV